MRFIVFALFVTLIIPLSGCVRTGYYLQSVRGHLDLMHRRVAIDKLISDADTPDELRDRLVIVNEIREFAVTDLGLPDNRSYRSYADLERPYVVWNVFAAPEFSVDSETWCFLFVGCIAYRGYFSEERAQKYAAELAEQGMDVYVAGVAAYSTLGRFADPVLNTMLAGDEIYLAGLIFHELSHQQLYIRDATAFNESFATLVQEEGLRRWLQHRGDTASWERWMSRRGHREQFNEIVSAARQRLQAVYAADLSVDEMREQKRLVQSELRAEHERLREEWGGRSGYERWFSGPLNNAQLGSVATYRLLVPAFRQLLIESGQDMTVFFDRAAEVGALPTDERERRLQELAARAER